MSSPHEDLHRLIDQLSPRLAGEVLDFVEFLRSRHGAELPEDRAWLDDASAEVGDRLSELEADTPPEQLEAWMRAMEAGAKPVQWDPTTGAFCLDSLRKPEWA